MSELSFKLLTALVLTSGLANLAFAAGPGLPRTEKSFNQLDGDNDGKLSLAEINPRGEKRLFRIDRNDDGSVTKEEIEAWLQKGLERRRDLMLADHDADHDGSITRDEWAAFLAAEFGKADKDGDGGVSLEESRSYRFVRAGDDNKPGEDDEE